MAVFTFRLSASASPFKFSPPCKERAVQMSNAPKCFVFGYGEMNLDYAPSGLNVVSVTVPLGNENVDRIRELVTGRAQPRHLGHQIGS